jgi:Ca2+-binding RTX toxin-like protein
VSGTEDTNLVFSSANGNAITVADVDSTPLTVTLTVANGRLTLSQTTGLTVTGDGTATVELTGSAADINAALQGLIYRGGLNYEGADTLGVVVKDSALATDSENIAITLANDGFINGDSGNNTLTGTPQSDIFLLQQGGNDNVTGLASRDAFYFGSAFTTADSVDGGGNADIVILQGNYTTSLAGITNLGNLGSISLFSGSVTAYGDTANNFYDYNLTSVDSNVAAGQILKINGAGLRVGEDLTFNGSAETDGSFRIYGGLGVDTLTGGAQNDNFFFGHNLSFGSSDRVNGGSGGYDVLYLRGDYTINFNAAGFGASTLTAIDSIGLLSFTDTEFASGGDGEFDYDLTWNDAMLATGQTMTVNGSRLTASETMLFNGSAETGGHFKLWGGAAADTLRGGAGNDLIFGGLGADTMTGGAGNDVFRYQSAAESTSIGRDGIQDFSIGDRIDLNRIDANSLLDGDQAFTFIGTAAFGNHAGELRYQSIGGTIWLVQGDTNGDGVSDFEFTLVVPDADPITASDFFL